MFEIGEKLVFFTNRLKVKKSVHVWHVLLLVEMRFGGVFVGVARVVHDRDRPRLCSRPSVEPLHLSVLISVRSDHVFRGAAQACDACCSWDWVESWTEGRSANDSMGEFRAICSWPVASVPDLRVF